MEERAGTGSCVDVESSTSTEQYNSNCYRTQRESSYYRYTIQLNHKSVAGIVH